MSWNVDVNDVLNRWIGDDVPDYNDALLNTLVSDSVVIINKKVRNIDERLKTEGDLQTLLNIVVSKMVQRAYSFDYSPYTNVSNTVGPQSLSYSKGNLGNGQGLRIMADELAMISNGEYSSSRVGIIQNVSSRRWSIDWSEWCE